MHTPTAVTHNAVEHAKRFNADSILSVGGGSSIGLGKAVSIRTGLPHIALPTTYAGSEMAPILGETENGRKTTRSDPAVRPGVVNYDVSYTLDLPSEMSKWCVESSSAHHDHSRTVCIPIMSIPFVDRQSSKEALFCYQGEPGGSFVE